MPSIHYRFVVISVPRRFIPYGPAYGEAVSFFEPDDGYSRTVYFRQKFLFGCRYYRRFWVRSSRYLLRNNVNNIKQLSAILFGELLYYRPVAVYVILFYLCQVSMLAPS